MMAAVAANATARVMGAEMIFATLLVTGFVAAAGASCTAEDNKGRCVEYGESTGVTCDPNYTLADPPGSQADCIKSRAQGLQGSTPPRLRDASHIWNTLQNPPWQKRSRQSRYG
jgi:hypothetical protein